MKKLISLCITLTLFLGTTNSPTFGKNKTDNNQAQGSTPAVPDRVSVEAASFSRTFLHHKVNVNGVRLHYLIGGKGDAVVLLHGWPTTWYAWHKVMPALAQRYTVIAPDLRGMGDSGKPTSGYDSRTVAEDIYQLVGKLGFKRVFIVAHDMGALPAYAYAAAHPEDVRRLVVLEFPLPGFGGEEFESAKNLWHARFNMQSDDIVQRLAEGKERDYVTYMTRGFAYDPTSITEADIDEYVRTYGAPGGMRSSLAHYRALPESARQIRESSSRKLPMPLLALGGEHWMGAVVLNSWRQVGSNVRGGVVKNCGHSIAEERPEFLIQQLFAFFGEEK